ncbi:MAG TPA: glutathione peroxidase, partial [Stellaceae bacterium]|nr:glutathione peroxidase [Stellaceae bacterium]
MAKSNAHNFSFSTIDGAPLPLAGFRGKPVLLVNTASFCGYTPQYVDLEALYQRFAAR